jgi:hypothetical protein
MKNLVYIYFLVINSNLLAQCDTLYQKQEGTKIQIMTLYLPGTNTVLDTLSGIQEYNLGILNKRKGESVIIDSLYFQDCNSLKGFDDMLHKLKEFDCRTIKKYGKEKIMFKIIVKFSSKISVENLVTILNRLYYTVNIFDINLTTNEIYIYKRCTY